MLEALGGPGLLKGDAGWWQEAPKEGWPGEVLPFSPMGLVRLHGGSSNKRYGGTVAVRNKGDFASDSSEIAICQQPPERLEVNESELESEGYHPH